MICCIATELFLLIFGGGGFLKGKNAQCVGWGALEQSMGREVLPGVGETRSVSHDDRTTNCVSWSVRV